MRPIDSQYYSKEKTDAVMEKATKFYEEIRDNFISCKNLNEVTALNVGLAWAVMHASKIAGCNHQDYVEFTQIALGNHVMAGCPDTDEECVERLNTILMEENAENAPIN